MATEKEKEALKAKARADAQTKAEEDKVAEIVEARQHNEDRNLGAAAPAPVTEAVGEAAEEWGPYDDYRLVTTPTGENGVPFGKVLFFKEVEGFDSRAGRMITKLMPFYRKATKTEMKPVLAIRDRKMAASRGLVSR